MGIFDFFKLKKGSHKNISKKQKNFQTIENNYISDGINYKTLPEKSYKLADVIMLYSFKDNPHVISKNINDYAQYYVYRYNVNPIKLSQRLLNEGYLSRGINNDNVSEFVHSLKIQELKDLLKNKNLKMSGKKIELVNRVLDNYYIEQIEEIYPNTREIYFLTFLGEQMIDKNKDLILLHKNYSRFMIEYDEYISAKLESSLSDFYEICINVFKKREKIYIKENMWGLLRNNYFNMFNAYKNKNDIDSACRHLIKAMYIDLSGINNNNLVIELNNSSLCLSKFLITIKDYYKDDYLEDCLDIPLPFTFFELATLKIIFSDILKECADIKKYKIVNKPKRNQEKYVYFKH